MKKIFYQGILAILIVICGASRGAAQYYITTHTATSYPDSLCTSPYIYIETNACSTGLQLLTYYGDGTSSMDTVMCSVSSGYRYLSHAYSSAGTYSLKHVLFLGGSPIDSVTETFTYQYCNTFVINAFNDLNSNCVYDSASESLVWTAMTVEVDSAGVPIDTLVTSSGFYYPGHGPMGTVYSFKVLSISGGATVSCPASGIITDTIQSTVNAYIYKTFAVVCSGASGFDLRESAGEIAGRHHSSINIFVGNDYCTPENATLTMHFSPKYNFASAYPAPSSVSGTTVVWSLPNVSMTHPYWINVSLEVPGTWITVGDTVHTDFTLTPASGDLDPTNNYISRVDTVTGAYDPNDKAVSPEGIVSAGTTLTYTINFENTGNDTAFNIHVMDTLSDNVDPKSLKIVTASAHMNLSVLNDGTHNIAKFDFPHINLPDSTHPNKNTGMFIYTVNTKAGLPDGTVIDNRAGIYFDYNPVVMTNTAENVIGTPSGVAIMSNVADVLVFPNPAKNELVVKTTHMDYNSLTVTNTLGQVMMRQSISTPQNSLDISLLPSGVYFVTLKGEHNVKTVQFEKL